MPGPSKSQIKVNALLRLIKEHDLYLKEEKEIEAKLSALEQASPKDEYEIRRTKSVLEDTRRVLPVVLDSIKETSAEVSKLGSLKPEEEKQANEAVEAAQAKLR